MAGRGMAWHGAQCGVTWHGAWCGAVRGVRPPDGSCCIVAQCVAVRCGVHHAAGRGIECGGVVRPPNVGRRGVGRQAVFGQLTCCVTSGCGVQPCVDGLGT